MSFSLHQCLARVTSPLRIDSSVLRKRTASKLPVHVLSTNHPLGWAAAIESKPHSAGSHAGEIPGDEIFGLDHQY